MRVELHCHSTCSDGTEPPERVAARAAARGVALFALTDHDSCAGSDAARIAGARVVRGVEISCDEPGSGRTIHVLAYARGGVVDEGWRALEERLAALREARRNRLRVMAARLEQRGIRVEVEPLIAAAETSGRAVGRPDLARAMLAAGAVTSIKEAFNRFLYDGGPVDVPHHALALPDALALGRAAGAAMSLAHPHVYGELGAALLKQHARDGLGGVEALYGGYDPRERAHWLSLAAELGLCATGGSDWHGPEDASAEPGVDLDDDRAARLLDWLAI